MFVLLIALAATLAGLRLLLLSGRDVGQTVTWDCGYSRPTARMQYTGSSFADPVVLIFAWVVRLQRVIVAPVGFFPTRAAFESATTDAARDSVYRPVARGLDRSLSRLRWLQHGRVNIYLLYIAVTLLLLLVWVVAFP